MVGKQWNVFSVMPTWLPSIWQELTDVSRTKRRFLEFTELRSAKRKLAHPERFELPSIWQELPDVSRTKRRFLEFTDLRSAKRKLAHPERFELPTKWFEATYSIQLSYGCN